MRTSNQKLHSSLKNQITSTFFQIIADIKDKDEADTFMSDFFTDAEMQVFAKRLAIAYWLKKGRSYNNIKTNLKVSSATIATVQSGMEKDGFELALKKIEAEEWANQWVERIRKIIK